MNAYNDIYRDFCMFDEKQKQMNKYCNECGDLMVTKNGKYGKFRGCESFPLCKNTEEHYEWLEITDNELEIK